MRAKKETKAEVKEEVKVEEDLVGVKTERKMAVKSGPPCRATAASSSSGVGGEAKVSPGVAVDPRHDALIRRKLELTKEEIRETESELAAAMSVDGEDVVISDDEFALPVQ